MKLNRGEEMPKGKGREGKGGGGREREGKGKGEEEKREVWFKYGSRTVLQFQGTVQLR